MEKRFLNKLITLANGKKCVVLNETVFEGKLYVLANEIENNDLNENIYIFCVNIDNDKISFVVEQDLEVCAKLLDIFEKENSN